MKKLNPRRKPATQADVNRAKAQATEQAMERAIALMLYILIDKHGAPKDDIQQLAKEVDSTAEAVAQGYVTWEDIQHVLVDEYDLEIRLE